ncbi:SDR family NAD(P)-dependent oxidoreductase [Novosphingobium pentaromativorans]|uniref:3-oxoacyl-(Acyl-carrier-protein) reductase n=1 Tax=Novosphingobium pentaromativorans US6-1 TaxID=1088721 RepID=G6ED68_9SPHN|nr:SDR family NAD(P)-dependent oxidoreductase [Novosphingobium pentaromativorans]AIT79838.1 3-hydroxyacyl-CoA dehydrogenase [Novosphingobium pentaromativorans US6-1]EHJ60780.1 3-oxoacyl-(acyl-carrier-protein) reductase [Novosphingobium pentaromativorans US6-1]
MAKLKDKVVAVTGAGRGIGREIALLAAREGAKVVVNDLGGSQEGDGADVGPAQEVVNEIKGFGGDAVANTADISNPQGAQSIIGDAIDRFGRIDGVVNNAGILRDRIFHKMSQDDWDTLIRINLNGYFYVSKAAALAFKEQGSGSFVHFTSTSGLIGNFGQANYSAAKMGVVGLSNSIALDMARSNVNSNCIAPFAWSRMTATIPPQNEEERKRVERIKSMTPDKIAPLAVGLLSDEAKEVTGQIFAVRKNEIFLFSVPRPIRSMHRSEGWTPDSIVSDLLPAFRSSFHKMERSGDVFSWDPI